MTALGVANTIPAGNVRHRLGLGIEWFDALSQLPAPRGWTSELRAIGSRPLVQRFEQHPRGRHALRHAGALVAWLERADEDKQAVPPATPADDPTNVVLYGYGQIHPDVGKYDTGNDPRVFVPRRLALTPVQAGGVPAATRDNIRQAWLWPGAAYPIPSKASAVRGCEAGGRKPSAVGRPRPSNRPYDGQEPPGPGTAFRCQGRRQPRRPPAAPAARRVRPLPVHDGRRGQRGRRRRLRRRDVIWPWTSLSSPGSGHRAPPLRPPAVRRGPCYFQARRIAIAAITREGDGLLRSPRVQVAGRRRGYTRPA